MDIFGDKQYENMDWVIKAIEPITFSMSDLIPTLPDKYVVNTVDQVERLLKRLSYSTSVNVTMVFNMMLEDHAINLTDFQRKHAEDFYKLYIDGEATVNMEDRTMKGSMVLEKIKNAYTEDDLKQAMEEIPYDEIRGWFRHEDEETVAQARLQEILDLCGDREGMQKRSLAKKHESLKVFYKKILKENKWNIRSVDMAIKIARWIRLYVEKGDMAAMTNFCRVKAMTHRGYPIYELEDEQ